MVMNPLHGADEYTPRSAACISVLIAFTSVCLILVDWDQPLPACGGHQGRILQTGCEAECPK